MSALKCKMCGGVLNISEQQTVCECEYCGSKQTVSNVDDEKIIKLYERANRLRMANEFDKSATVYESIIEEDDTEAEAYWGLMLCKYGIEYVDDPTNGNKVPTCHRSSFDSFMDDPDFEMVMSNSDTLSRAVYREQAKQIEEIRRGIIEVSGKEPPYDIFICYKETDENGDRTIDSVIAQDVYETLVEKGYRVFFSRISLEDKLGVEYEPFIFAALNSAKVMLAFGTSYDYYNAVWVKNEWSRYLKLMAKDKTKYLIPCYKDIDAYDMPKEFKALQAQDMGKVGAIQDLIRGVEKILGPRKTSVSEERRNDSADYENHGKEETFLKRGKMALEDEEWDKAAGFFNEALNIVPECAEAYLGIFLAESKFDSLTEAIKIVESYTYSNEITFDMESTSLKRAEQFSNGSLQAEVQRLIGLIKKKQKEKALFALFDICEIVDNKIVKCKDKGIEKIVIPGCITSVGESAFGGCESLTSITIPESVTSIGDEAFPPYCNIIINEGNARYKSENGMIISRDENKLIMFCSLDAEKSIIIPEGVTSIGYSAFSGCESLTSITIPGSVTSIGDYAFSGCESLTSITIPGSVTSIGDYAFTDCKSLTSITISEGVTSIGYSAFSGCESLTSITIPDSVTSIGYYAFAYCWSLTSITISDSVTSIGHSAFPTYCNVIINKGNARYKSENGMIISRDENTLIMFCSRDDEENITIPEGVTSIGDGAFSECKSLTNIIIPEGVTSIGEYAFSGCKSLSSVIIPKSVTDIGEDAFYLCKSLSKVTISKQIDRNTLGIDSSIIGNVNFVFYEDIEREEAQKRAEEQRKAIEIKNTLEIKRQEREQLRIEAESFSGLFEMRKKKETLKKIEVYDTEILELGKILKQYT